VNILESLELALKNIWGSKTRTLLTMLGIVIGVTAVIVIVGLGNGMEQYMTDSFSAMGTNTLTVMIKGRGSSRSVSEEEMYAIKDRHPEYFDKISPTVTLSATVKVGTETLDSTAATGVSEDYFEMKDYAIASGRGIEYVDVSTRKNVCVVGQYVNQTYYMGGAVGQSIKLNGKQFTIVGVMAQETDQMEEGGTDDCVFLPYSVAARMSNTGTINSYTLTLVDENQAEEAKTLMESELYQIFEDDDAYQVNSMSELLDTMTGMINMVITILAAIAAISLVVGGIGIMNIMLVSVTERTREIGIRKALGAKERYIMQQFVIEAGTTSALGGIVGILLGYALSSVATVVITTLTETEITVSPSFTSVLLAVGVSVGIGVVFGYLPAKKAAVLNPIDALRYE
jgi:putative ABC transport system permease protein